MEKQKMKYLRFVILVLYLCGMTSLRGQTSVDSLYIDDIKTDYYVNSSLVVKYTNKSKKPLYVSVSLQRSTDNNDWVTVLKDIFYPNYIIERSEIIDDILVTPLSKLDFSSNSTTPITSSRTDAWIVDKRLLLFGKQQTYRLKYIIETSTHNICPVIEKEEKPKVKIMYSQPFHIRSK